MSYLFYNCEKLTTLDLDNFDTSNVTDMGWMFCGCNVLSSLDLSNLDTHNVKRMDYMFCGCQKLSSLDLSNFDTSNVFTMEAMFQSCRDLVSLDISSFDTTNVKYMDSMFSWCQSFIELDLSNFYTPNITDLRNMFSYCLVLSVIDLSNFDISNVVNLPNGLYMNEMFDRCVELETIYVSDSWEIATDTWRYSSYNMFMKCSKLPNYDESVVNITNAHYGEGGYLTYKAASVSATSMLDSILNLFVPQVAYADDDVELTTYTTDSNGQIAIKGIASGHYTLHEINAPERYWVMDGNEITVDLTVDLVTKTLAVESNGTLIAVNSDVLTTTVDEDNVIIRGAALTVENMKTIQLALTGGVSVGIFGIVMFGLMMFVVSRKRKSETDKVNSFTIG